MVEVNIGIWCASIPALKALIRHRPREGSEQARSRVYQYHSKDRSGTAGKGSSSGGVSVGMESFDLVMDDTGKVVKAKKRDGNVPIPKAAVGRKQSNVDSEWSEHSEDRIFPSGGDGKM